MVLVLGTLLAATPSAAQRTRGLDEIRAAVDSLTQEFADVETELGRLEGNLVANEAEVERLDAEVEARRDAVGRAAVAQFMIPTEPVLLSSDDLVQELRARHLGASTLADETDELEEYSLLRDQLAEVRAVMDAQRAEASEKQARLVEARVELNELLGELEALEAERLEELRRQAEEEARRRAEEAARQAAAAGSSGGSAGTSGGGTVSQPSTSGGLLVYCPVQGSVSFVDTWGAPRSGGRSHKGVDMFASIGTPVAAPVAGTVSHRSNGIGGRSYHLNGDDGNYYYGTHLSAYGESGWVEAGTIIGYVGDDGNARGIPHLHFEIHPGGGSAVNPYPATRDAC